MTSKQVIACVFVAAMLTGCSSEGPQEGWRCEVRGQTMFSMSTDGQLGAAEKGCTCSEMADFNQKTFGDPDYETLNKEHGCGFD